MMDIARYGVEWFRILTSNTSKERKYILGFMDNLRRYGPAITIVEEETDDILSVYIYLFPDEDMFSRFIQECDYESYRISFNKNKKEED